MTVRQMLYRLVSALLLANNDRGYDRCKRLLTKVRRFDHIEVLEPEKHGYEAITLDTKQRWTILAKVLWWIAMAPQEIRACSPH